MQWTKEQLEEALACIEAIKASMSATHQSMDRIIAELKEMQEAADRTNGQLICADAPSISPN